MDSHTGFIQSSIIQDMAEGVMTIGLNGDITFLNPAAAEILDRPIKQLLGRSFAGCFLLEEENDAFVQTILDAVYDKENTHRNIVPYFTGKVTRQLSINTSFLMNGEERIGVIAVLSDISELSELRDAIKAMERIRALNDQLELRNKLLNETFGRFLSDEIVRQLLETPDGLTMGGKKRSLTVMMSDLRGFTAISERMPAQDLITMLNHYLGEMTEAITKYNGTIIEFIGDGIMALFGNPIPSDTHAADAAAAALSMQIRMQKINEWNRAQGFPMLEMGIGLNTGEVIVGNIGSEKRTKYGVVGSHVNLCGRIESYTVGGQILISPETRTQITEPLEIAAEQTVFPKGVAAPLVLSQITGIGGKYDLYCRPLQEDPVPLHVPAKVSYVAIHEKHVDADSTPARFTALCRSGAVLETEGQLQPYLNLQIDIGGKLFCKVLKQQGSGWLVRFTSLPPAFDEWYRAQA